MAKSRSRSPLRMLMVPLHERLRHPEAHLTGRRPPPSNSVIYLMYAKYLLSGVSTQRRQARVEHDTRDPHHRARANLTRETPSTVA